MFFAFRTMLLAFLSTPSARRATQQRNRYFIKKIISIHALREEGDLQTEIYTSRRLTNFYPRPPRGGRLDIFLVVGLAEVISIHALREEGDR